LCFAAALSVALFIEIAGRVEPEGPKIEAAGRNRGRRRVKAQGADNGGRRPILWHRSSGVNH